MRQAGRFRPQPGARKGRHHRLRHIRRREVDIRDRPPSQRIAHRAADNPCRWQGIEHGQQRGIGKESGQGGQAPDRGLGHGLAAGGSMVVPRRWAGT